MQTITRFIVILLILCIPLGNDLLRAQDAPAKQFKQEYPYSIGAAAGFSTGYGLSFRYWPTKYGVQVNFAPYYDDIGTMISFGATGLMEVENNGWSRFYFYLGNHIHYDSYRDTYENTTRRITTWVIGAGPGLEFLIRDRVGINIMFGIASFADNENYWMLNLTGETGLYYRF